LEIFCKAFSKLLWLSSRDFGGARYLEEEGEEEQVR
jgi:hypothetical protein